MATYPPSDHLGVSVESRRLELERMWFVLKHHVVKLLPYILQFFPNMSSFTFNTHDILNSTLIPDQAYDTLFYTTSTTSGFLGRKVTTLVPSTQKDGAFRGVINWKEDTFEIGGTIRKRLDLKRNPGGILNRSVRAVTS